MNNLIMETIGDRIKRYRESKRLSQAGLAKLCGWGASRIGNYEANVRDVDSQTATIIASSLNISPVVLMFGESEESAEYVGKISTRPITVKGEALMGYEGSFEMDESFNGMLLFVSDDPEAFALKVKGDSMFPRINSGEFVVIEPKVKPSSGDEVMVRTFDGKNMIKRLEYHRDGVYRFISINQDHAPITLDESMVDKVYFVAAIVKSSRFRDVCEM